LTPIDNDGVVSWVKNVPETPEPEKKEYLTKKKLQSKIADIETEMADLDGKYGGKPDSALLFGTSDEMTQYADLAKQKAEFQTLLDKKLLTEQKKALTKQQITLQAEFDSLETKTYSGIWKDDITTADWFSKKNSVKAKQDYFLQKQLDASDPDEIEKWKQLLSDLDEFDAQGKHYHEIQSELQQTQAALTSLKKNGIIKGGIDDTFSQARKDGAFWAQTKEEADEKLRELCGEVWQNATQAERRAIYEYTSGSGGFNRPLRGYQGSWSEYSFKGVGNVDLDYEGKASAIKRMTELIDKSSYDFDVWLQRGVENTTGASGFLQITESQLRDLTQNELESLLLNKVVTDEAFLSCGSAKGQGFSGSYIFNVYCPSGTKMMYAEPFSHYGNGAKLNWDGVSSQYSFGYEDETIIQRGTTFKITKVEKTGSRVFFDIEVVSQR
jgi:hypothetical protein